MKTTLSNHEKKSYIYLLDVISAVINGKSIPCPPEGVSAFEVLKLSAPTSMDAMFSDAMLKLPKELFSDNELKYFRNHKNKALIKDINQLYEIDKILKVFDEYKIKNVPLKGFFLKKEYPQSEYRYMCDLDILIDYKEIDMVKKALLQLEYIFESNDDNQYHFKKEPYMFVEAHTSIVHENELYYPYVKDILNTAEPWGEYEYSCNIKPEDFYLYMLIHTSNHFRLAGMGIRMILDIYLYYLHHSSKFDFCYLNEMLEVYKLKTFEEKLRKTAYEWFSPDSVVTDLNELETFIILSGLIGTTEKAIMISSSKEISKRRNQGKNASKLNYLLKSIFPPSDKLIYQYPYLNKSKIFLPAAWISMWFNRIFIKRNVHLKRGLTLRLNYRQDDVDYYKKIALSLGFDDLN